MLLSCEEEAMAARGLTALFLNAQVSRMGLHLAALILTLIRLETRVLTARVIAFGLLRAPQLLQVMPLYRLVQRELGQRVVHREPLSFAPHQPRVLPLRQLLGHSQHVHLGSVLMLAVLETESIIEVENGEDVTGRSF